MEVSAFTYIRIYEREYLIKNLIKNHQAALQIDLVMVLWTSYTTFATPKLSCKGQIK
jgi:hypothetical protein